MALGTTSEVQGLTGHFSRGLTDHGASGLQPNSISGGSLALFSGRLGLLSAWASEWIRGRHEGHFLLCGPADQET